MKAFLLSLACLACSLNIATTTPSIQTSSRYARAETYSAYFCQTKQISSALFTIPYTYCVEVLSEEDGWYTVKYAEDYGIYRALYGYCQVAALTMLSSKPETLWLYKEVTVTYSASYSQSSTQGSMQGTLPVLDTITQSAAFYGTYYNGPTPYAYVLCGTSFGYIDGGDITYPLNVITEATTEETPSEEETTDQTTQTQTPSVVAVIFICIFAAAVLILLFVLTHKKPKE
jgi:hypothetical protein